MRMKSPEVNSLHTRRHSVGRRKKPALLAGLCLRWSALLAALLLATVLVACGGGEPDAANPTNTGSEPALSPDTTDDEVSDIDWTDPIQVAEQYATPPYGVGVLSAISRLFSRAADNCDYDATLQMCYGLLQLDSEWDEAGRGTRGALFDTAPDWIVVEIDPSSFEENERGGSIGGTATGDINIVLRDYDSNLRLAQANFTMPLTLQIRGSYVDDRGEDSQAYVENTDIDFDESTLDFQWVEDSSPQDFPFVRQNLNGHDSDRIKPYLLVDKGGTLEFSFQVTTDEGLLAVAVLDPDDNEIFRTEVGHKGSGSVIAPTLGDYTFLLEDQGQQFDQEGLPFLVYFVLEYRVLPEPTVRAAAAASPTSEPTVTATRAPTATSAPIPTTTFTAISTGLFHTCGLREDGAAVCWGLNEVGESSPPAGLTFTAISAGGFHTCGLREDGSAVCWGDDGEGQASPPEGETFTAISSGNGHTCGLRIDGSAVCWGFDGDGRTSPPEGTFAAISSGGWHTCGLREDGSAACWGQNLDGQASPPDGEIFAAISSRQLYTCGLREDGSAECWGNDSFGELRREASPPTGETFVAISTGGGYTCGLREDGSAECWGYGSSGQASPPTGETFVAISSGGEHTCALRVDGSAVCWGLNASGQADPP